MQAFDLSAREILRIDPQIRWASMVTKTGDIIFSETREEVKPLLTEEGIATFIEANRPNSILQACENFSTWDGQVRSALVEYEKMFLYAIAVENKVLAISCNKTTSHQEFSEIANKLQTYIHARMTARRHGHNLA